MTNPRPDRPLFLVHLPKTAGTSVVGLLGARFDPARTLSLEGPFSPARTLPEGIRTAGEADALLGTLDTYDFVYGHVPLAMRRLFNRTPFVLTFLRDPIERSVSAFHYLLSDAVATVEAAAPDALRVGARARALGLAGLIRKDPLAAAWHLGNVQVRMLGQDPGRGWYGTDAAAWPPVGAADLARACENLVACDAFGLTEHLGESIDLLAYALRIEHPGAPGWANRTPGRPAVAALDAETLASLQELTVHDRALFRFGADLFEQRRRAMMRTLLARRARDGAPRPETTDASAFHFDGPIPGEGWYAPEQADGGTFSWTGPERESWLMLRSPTGGGGARLEVDVQHALLSEQLSGTTLLANGWPLPRDVSATATGHRISAMVPAWLLRPQGEANRITIIVERVARPCDIAPENHDSRLLGLAIRSVALIAAA